ncbi:MAG: hypothetical protein P4L49_18875 [Desulfosporosinus sp.]|nr:hypothetical protein [Desulfosporosinus sp.]
MKVIVLNNLTQRLVGLITFTLADLEEATDVMIQIEVISVHHNYRINL